MHHWWIGPGLVTGSCWSFFGRRERTIQNNDVWHLVRSYLNKADTEGLLLLWTNLARYQLPWRWTLLLNVRARMLEVYAGSTWGKLESVLQSPVWVSGCCEQSWVDLQQLAEERILLALVENWAFLIQKFQVQAGGCLLTQKSCADNTAT